MRYLALDQTQRALASQGVPAQQFRANTIRLYERHCSEWQKAFDRPWLPCPGQPNRGAA